MSADWDDAYNDIDPSVPTIDTVFLGEGRHMPSAALLLERDMDDAVDVLLARQCVEWAVKLRESGFENQNGGMWFPSNDELARFGNVINAQLSRLGVSGMGDNSRVRWVRVARLALLGDEDE